jgi:hypothetical protein
MAKQTAAFTGVGPGLNYADGEVFAYSGPVSSTDSATPIQTLNYTTGSKSLLCIFEFFDISLAAYERVFKITLNGNTIVQTNYDGSEPSFPYDGRYHVIIPPRSVIEVLANINGASVNMFVTMTGKVL